LLASGKAENIEEALETLGITTMSDEELEALVAGVVERNRRLITEKGDRAFSVLMGEAMKVARGKVDGGKVSEALRRKMARATQGR